MNETDFIRRQLALEHAHLRELLEAVRAGAPGLRNARAVLDYIEWGSGRILAQLGEPAGAVTQDRLLGLIDVCATRLESQTGRALPLSHWRRAAPLSADTILEERRLYAAARAAAGLP